jgi:hypothetical protein
MACLGKTTRCLGADGNPAEWGRHVWHLQKKNDIHETTRHYKHASFVINHRHHFTRLGGWSQKIGRHAEKHTALVYYKPLPSQNHIHRCGEPAPHLWNHTDPHSDATENLHVQALGHSVGVRHRKDIVAAVALSPSVGAKVGEESSSFHMYLLQPWWKVKTCRLRLAASAEGKKRVFYAGFIYIGYSAGMLSASIKDGLNKKRLSAKNKIRREGEGVDKVKSVKASFIASLLIKSNFC